MVTSTVILSVCLTIFFVWYRLRVHRPLRRMIVQVEKMGAKDYKARTPLEAYGIGLIQNLTSALNELAVNQYRHMKELSNQNSDLNSVLGSLNEGVMAVDLNERIILYNRAASQIFAIQPQIFVGRSIQEAVRVPEIQEFITSSFSRDEAFEEDVEIIQGKRLVTLHLKSSPLRTAKGVRIGVVLGFSDITNLRKLESHRREFVANVSHELRTPLTSIQGFAETLMNPKVQDPNEIRKFLGIIHRHAARLGGIIDDLLALSKIEKQVEASHIELKLGSLRPSIVAAIELCEMKARAKGVLLKFDCPADLKAKINGPLLEQAIVNLIDNALKYSSEGKKVEVAATKIGKEIVLSVRDHGPGIAREHIPRLFERFYRVDGGRSRDVGGTGLGLSIVKHVSIAHRGRLEVQSEVGKGSEFSLHLPV